MFAFKSLKGVRVLRLFGFIMLAAAIAGGLLFMDFNRVVREATAADLPAPSLGSYLATVPEKLFSLTGSPSTATARNPLADMLPEAPEGWTMRPPTEDDLAAFLPRSGTEGNPEAIKLVTAAVSSRAEWGEDLSVMAYERGERSVVFQLTRLSNDNFDGSIDRRHDLQVKAAELRGSPFLTTRGLDVIEESLGDGLRARLFSASVGAQIQLRVVASSRLDDGDLSVFFDTLDVKAMNRAVIDPEPGLGEIPVLVLVSALGESDRSLYEAERSARSAAAIKRAAAVLQEARERAAAVPDGT